MLNGTDFSTYLVNQIPYLELIHQVQKVLSNYAFGFLFQDDVKSTNEELIVSAEG